MLRANHQIHCSRWIRWHHASVEFCLLPACACILFLAKLFRQVIVHAVNLTFHLLSAESFRYALLPSPVVYLSIIAVYNRRCFVFACSLQVIYIFWLILSLSVDYLWTCIEWWDCPTFTRLSLQHTIQSDQPGRWNLKRYFWRYRWLFKMSTVCFFPC